MGFIKKTLFLFIALVAFLVALLAAADNSAEVALRFLEYETPVWPISWWMISAFVVGVVFGNCLTWFLILACEWMLAAQEKLRMAGPRSWIRQEPSPFHKFQRKHNKRLWITSYFTH